MNLTGKLLIASPNLLDPNFRRTVVLMVQDSDDGAIGLILNRQSDKLIKNLWETIFQITCPTEQRLNLGGPVFGPLMLLHTRHELADWEILPGLYFASKKEYLEETINNDIQPFRLFLGHSGWEAGQLQTELNEGAWYVISTTSEFIFDDDEELWQKAIQLIGRQQLSRLLNTTNLPYDPTIN